ncbi:TetR family transcriptional regulator [Actinotalea fermentans]|uniref:TetR family transcriptional regulator n=1 Tax=Actinotalea fermentans TaxID=43671 RepID=A0A511YZM7_9CELL|nr:TetR family transcriptional regulator [Actinotalea fermentans]
MARDVRRAQILEIAQDLFARQGYHHVSMDDIADRAEVSKPVLYRHFPSKLDLYLDVVDHRAESLLAAIDVALADDPDDGRGVVRALVRAYLEFVEQAGDSFSLLFESDVTRDAEVRRRVELASADAAEAVCRGLRELAGLAPEQARLLSTALVGMARVAATARYRTGEVPVDEAVDLITGLAWRGVAGFVSPAEPALGTGAPLDGAAPVPPSA